MSETKPFWAQNENEILYKFNVSNKTGLSEKEAQKRLQQYGLNQISQTRSKTAWSIFFEQFKSIIIAVLAVAGILSFVMKEWMEGTAVMIAILINTSVGFFSELRAVRSMEALQKLSRTSARVFRDNDEKNIPSQNVVPGDIITLESGNIVPADCRLIQASKVQVNESSLTGESVPVSKTTTPIYNHELPLAERKNMLYKGTSLTRGTASGVVVATGMNTELGNISALAQEAGTQKQTTPMERRLNQLGKWLVWLTLAVALIVAVSGIAAGRNLRMMIEIAIALAVAAVPEGLPIVATAALARGMWRMAKRNALIRKLAAVETLGATSVICTDKTGTLTENQMTLKRIILPDGDYELSGEGLTTKGDFINKGETINPLSDNNLVTALEIGILCNDAELDNLEKLEVSGDPMEIALLVAGEKAQISFEELNKKQKRVKEEAFDPEIKMMATFHELENNRYRVAVKGATSAVLQNCTKIISYDKSNSMSGNLVLKWEQNSDNLANEGFRILALAEKFINDINADPYDKLTFIGIIGLVDPPRQSVRPALRKCQKAGIRVVMVTGDQSITARNVGKAVGLLSAENGSVIEGNQIRAPDKMSQQEREKVINAAILSRVSPQQKLNLIDLHRRNNKVVAMTGDGVNDAPALEKADIGIAMGCRGTDVAKEAADMVLQDDAFSTIVAAVEQGRAIFTNIRAFTIYLLSGNTGEILAVGITAISGFPIPLLPLQILYINAVNDTFPALALGMGKGAQNLMNRPPRDPEESILTIQSWITIVIYGLIIGATILTAYFLAEQKLGFTHDQANTVSFISLGFARLWHVFNMRQNDSGIFLNEITRNRFLWGTLFLGSLLLFIAVYLPGLSDALGTHDPGLSGWILILITSLIPLVTGQIYKLSRKLIP